MVGIDAESDSDVHELRSTRAELASRVLRDVATYPGLASRVSQLDVTNTANAIVTLEGDAVRVFVGTGAFAERLQRYLELAAVLREQVSQIDYVDLRYEDRVYLRPHQSEANLVMARGSTGP